MRFDPNGGIEQRATVQIAMALSIGDLVILAPLWEEVRTPVMFADMVVIYIGWQATTLTNLW